MKKLLAAITAIVAFASPAVADEWVMFDFAWTTETNIVETVAMNDNGVVCSMGEGNADCKHWDNMSDLRRDSILETAAKELDSFKELAIVAPTVSGKAVLEVTAPVTLEAVSVNTHTGKICVLSDEPSCSYWVSSSNLSIKLLSEARNMLITSKSPTKVFAVMNSGH